MKSGRLRHRLVISDYTFTVGSNGESVKTWATFATVYGECRPVSAREYLQADGEKQQGEISHIVTIRHLAGVKSKQRITWEGRTLEVVGWIPDRTDKKMLQATCKEVTA